VSLLSMGWSSSCEAARGPRELTDRLWQLVVAHHTSDYPDNVTDEEDSELDAVIDDYGYFLDRTQELMRSLGGRGACIGAGSVKYEFTDALWDEVERLLRASAGIEHFLHDDCEGISYVRISDPGSLLSGLSSTASVECRMQRAMAAALEQFAFDDRACGARPYGRPCADSELESVARQLRCSACTPACLGLGERQRRLEEAIQSLKRGAHRAQSGEDAHALDAHREYQRRSPFCDDFEDDDDGFGDYSRGGGLGASHIATHRQWEKRRIAYQFAVEHLQEALQACRELGSDSRLQQPGTASRPSGTEPSPQARRQRSSLSSREQLQQLCRDAAHHGQHVVVIHSVI